jgi:hypothetical protein
VLGIILLVDVSYWQLVGRFPMGGGSAEGAARAFGTGRVFVPIGALIVDFVLTISISVAAGVSALIAYLPALAPARIVLGLGLLVLVAGLTWFGHGGRLIFAVMTLLFVASAIAVLAHGYAHPAISHGRAPVTGAEGDPLFAVLFSYPVGDGTGHRHRGPVTAMAQLGQIGPADRRRFARGTLAATFVIVAGLTIGLAWLAVRLHVGIPGTDSTQIADVARAAAGSSPVYALFQAPGHPGGCTARRVLRQPASHLRPTPAAPQRAHRFRLPGHHRYQLTPLDRQVAVLFTKAHGRVLTPGLIMLDPRLAEDIPKRSPLATTWRQFDHALDQFITEGLAAA